MTNELIKRKAVKAGAHLRDLVKQNSQHKGIKYDGLLQDITENQIKRMEREIIRSETAKIRERKKRANKHSQTRDLFADK